MDPESKPHEENIDEPDDEVRDSEVRERTGETDTSEEQSLGDGVESVDAASEDLDDDGERSSEHLIEDSKLFKSVDLDDRRRLFDTGERVTFEPGEIILEEGEEGDSFFLVEEGEVEVTTMLEGKTVVLATLTRGDIFGEVTAFSGKPRTATVAAASLVDVIRFKNEELKLLLEKNPEVRDELQIMILDRAQDTIEKITKNR